MHSGGQPPCPKSPHGRVCVGGEGLRGTQGQGACLTVNGDNPSSAPTQNHRHAETEGSTPWPRPSIAVAKGRPHWSGQSRGLASPAAPQTQASCPPHPGQCAAPCRQERTGCPLRVPPGHQAPDPGGRSALLELKGCLHLKPFPPAEGWVAGAWLPAPHPVLLREEGLVLHDSISTDHRRIPSPQDNCPQLCSQLFLYQELIGSTLSFHRPRPQCRATRSHQPACSQRPQRAVPRARPLSAPSPHSPGVGKSARTHGTLAPRGPPNAA